VIVLPYAFDTTAVWQRIVKIVLTIGGVLLLSVVGGLATGKFGGAIGLAIAAAILFWLVRRVRGFPMGAAGTLTETGIATRPVRVWWYSLPVPVGQYPIDRFESIRVVERVIMPQPGNSGRNTGSVQLVGKGGTPDIEVAFQDIDSAIVIAQDLGTLLHLPVARVDAPGTRTARVTLG